jgi:hypothetical protein
MSHLVFHERSTLSGAADAFFDYTAFRSERIRSVVEGNGFA